jgi:hypothetical protein
MWIGWFARIHAGPPRATLCSSVTSSSPDPPRARTSSPDRAPRLSITPWPTAWLKLVGSGSSSRSSMLHCQRALLSTVTTSASSTSPPNLVQHQRTKHVDIDLHFVSQQVAIGDVYVLHVPTTSQFVDIFMKGLPTSVFLEFWSSLNIRCGYNFDYTEGGGGGWKMCCNIGTLGLGSPP